MPLAAGQLKDARIVVVGAGAVGSVLTYRLAQAGALVTLVDRRHPGAGTSANSFAWLNSLNKPPRHYHRLNARSMREHVDLAREIGGEWVHMYGGLNWAHQADSAAVQQIRQTIRQVREWGYRVETATPEQVMREIEPDLFVDPNAVDEVFVTPTEGWVNGVGLCHEVASAAVRRYGATIHCDAVVELRGPRGGGVDAVVLAGGTVLAADVVVNAAGPDAPRVAALAGVKLPVQRQIGLMVVSEPAPISLRSVVRAPESHIRPDGGWRLIFHRESYDSLVVEGDVVGIDHPICAQAVANALPLLPGLKGIKAEGVRVGIRPMPLDGHSIVGFEPDVPGLYEVVTHSGITLSAFLGQLVTEELAGTEPPELAPYRPSRFAAGIQIGAGGE